MLDRSSRLTRPLQVTVAVCSLVLTVGTAVHGFVIIDTALIETMMRASGVADPVRAAPGFTVGLQLVGALYVVGNAAGILAWWSRSRVLWWVVLAVNATQGVGYLAIPPEMWTAVVDRYGPAGALPSLVTDGGGALLAIVLVVALVRYRSTWARLRPPAVPSGSAA